MKGSSYNGFGPAERTGTLAALREAMASGTLPVPTHCSMCGRPADKPLGFHSEDYRRPLTAYPICWGCHVRVHARFRHPDRWRAFVSGLDPDAWFQRLSLDLATLTRPFDVTYPNGLGGP